MLTYKIMGNVLSLTKVKWPPKYLSSKLTHLGAYLGGRDVKARYQKIF